MKSFALAKLTVSRLVVYYGIYEMLCDAMMDMTYRYYRYYRYILPPQASPIREEWIVIMVW